MKSLIRLTIIFFFIILWVLNPIPFVSFEDIVNPHSISQSQEITYVRGGAFDPLQKKNNSSKIPKIILEKYFPDWDNRVNFQNHQFQFQFLQSGRKKIQEADRLRLSDINKVKLLKPEEKDAFDYLNGTEVYKYHQDVTNPSNIFDTRDSFLAKMQNSEMRNNFLKSSSRRKLNQNN
jgi:hypothetical protein